MKPWKKAPLINLSRSTTIDSIKAHRRVLGLHIAQTTKLFFFVSIELEVEKNIRDYKYCEITTAPSRKQLRIWLVLPSVEAVCYLASILKVKLVCNLC